MKPYDLMSVALDVQRMRRNAERWHEAGEEECKMLELDNRAIARSLQARYGIPVVYDSDGGTWHVGGKDGPLLFDLY